MEGEATIRFERRDVASKLAVAYDHLADVLETIDMERDRELAEAVCAAVTATDHARGVERVRLAQSAADRQALEVAQR